MHILMHADFVGQLSEKSPGIDAFIHMCCVSVHRILRLEVLFMVVMMPSAASEVFQSSLKVNGLKNAVIVC